MKSIQKIMLMLQQLLLKDVESVAFGIYKQLSDNKILSLF